MNPNNIILNKRLTFYSFDLGNAYKFIGKSSMHSS